MVRCGSTTELRSTSIKSDGTLLVEPWTIDLRAPLAFMAMIGQLALIALLQRPVPSGS